MNAVAVFEKIKSDVERIVNDAPHSMHTMEPMDEWRQGDVRIIRLPDDLNEKYLKPLDKVPTQLAPGTTTGSRHCLDCTDGVDAYELQNGNQLDGPVLKISEPRSIVHPEHGDCCELRPGWYAFPGQRAYADELRRVAD